jgi:hypothetical protein
MQALEPTEHPFQAQPGFDIRPYFWHAVCATLAVFGLPAAIVLGIIMLPSPDPSVVVTSALSVGLSTIASVIGTSIWMRTDASADVSFGDLMIWGWVRRRHAEGALDKGTRLLGLDRRGQPVQRTPITRDKQLKVLHELNDALEAKDPYTRGHSERVERHVYRTAAAMGLSVHDLQELRMAAGLHDIGKIRVPDRIIRKPGKLTAEERSLMEEHSVVGAWMLSHVASADVISAVRHHHERWDGKGYPDGLAGTDIPLYARIIAVCDTFDAITSTRPYRVKAERARAIEVLKAESGSQFDPMAVDVFLKSLPTKAVPVTAALLMLPGAGRLLREMARMLKRAGASSLASATTAASASVIIGAATVAPFVDQLPSRPPAPVVAPAAAQLQQAAPEPETVGDLEATRSKPRGTGRVLRNRVARLDADLERVASDLDPAGLVDEGLEGIEEVPGDDELVAVAPVPVDATEDVIESVSDLEGGKDNGKSEDNGHGKSDGASEKSDDKPGRGNGEGSSGSETGKDSGKGNGKGSGKGNDKGDADEPNPDPDAPDGSGDTGGDEALPDPGNGNGPPSDDHDADPGSTAPGNGNGNGNGNGKEKDKS